MDFGIKAIQVTVVYPTFYPHPSPSDSRCSEIEYPPKSIPGMIGIIRGCFQAK